LEPNPHNTTDTGPAAYRAVRDATCRAGHYLPLPQPWIDRLGVRAAALLMRVMTTGRISASPDGWMLLTEHYVEQGLGYGPELQDKLLDVLGDEGLVEVDGYGTRRRERATLRGCVS
jgi:hypothetical protein